MADTVRFSLQCFAGILIGAVAVFALRVSPLVKATGGLAAAGWREWWARSRRGWAAHEGEHLVVRVARLIALCAEYGVWAWGLAHPENLNVPFWALLWATLLVLSLMRKCAQFEYPTHWEHLGLKLHSHSFWWIHLALLATVEIQLPTGRPWALLFLLACHALVRGSTGQSLLDAFEDVVSVALALLAGLSLAGLGSMAGTPDYWLMLAALVPLRGAVRALLGREWLTHRFWWVAQFCLLSALALKALAVLDVFSQSRP
jgi:hypothetical protein